MNGKNFEENLLRARYRSQSATNPVREQPGSRIRERDKECLDALCKAYAYWSALHDVREERRRNLRYKNGDQWGDYVEGEDGRPVKEEALISAGGKIPLKHNFIQQFIRNITGQLLNNENQSVVFARCAEEADLSEMLTNTLQAANYLNETDKLSMNVLEELLLAGIACVKIRYDFWSSKNRGDGRIDLVNINRLFFNTDLEDPRMSDLNFIGELHDYTPAELVRNFASTPAEEKELLELYHPVSDAGLASAVPMDPQKLEITGAFSGSPDGTKCRVIEIWEKKGRWVTYVHDYADGTERVTDLRPEAVEAENARRRAQCAEAGIEEAERLLLYAEPRYEYYWSVKYLTPQGVCLKEAETPYAHEEHPYVLAALPMTDGGIKSGIGDLIDMQRYINRLIVMLDFIIGTSAKGVLMVPENAIPDGMSAEDFAREYTKANGVIVYRPLPGREVPYQVSSNSTNVGAWEMLQLQLGLIEKISGLSGAIQGQAPAKNTPSSLYAQQAQNSSLNYAVLFRVFNLFAEKRDEKLLKVLMQYYTDKRHVDISGRAYSETARYYDPLMARKITDFNVRIRQSADSPVFRQMTENILMEFVKGGLIPLDVYLDNSSMPFAEKLAASLRNKQQQLAEAQQTPAGQPAAALPEQGPDLPVPQGPEEETPLETELPVGDFT